MKVDPYSTGKSPSEPQSVEKRMPMILDTTPAPPNLFKAGFYSAQNPDAGVSKLSPWDHFCQIGFRGNWDPHPLFDTQFYRRKYLAKQPNVNPLLHYVRNSQKQLNPHPLLDVEYYVAQLDPIVAEKKSDEETWLEYFLEHNLEDLKSASIEFSAESYVEQYPDIRQRGENPLYHYVTQRIGQDRIKLKDCRESPPLFDRTYYLESNPDLSTSKLDSWQHFCEHGFKENRNPNPCFHTAYYRERYLGQTPDVNPLLHYLQLVDQVLDPHPLFDAAFYLSQISMTIDALSAGGITPLEHFLKHNRVNLASPSPLFSSRRYLEHHQDIASCQANPLYHFIVHGQNGRRQSFVDSENLELLRFRSEYELKLMSQFQVQHQDFITSTVNTSLNQTIVCVSHEASMTGAPLIILEIAEKLHDKYGIDIINVLCRGGKLQPRFELLGPTINLDGHAAHHWPEKYAADIDLFRELIANANVLGVLVNSAESRHVLPELRKLNVPIHSLVHENARCYPTDEFRQIAEYSDKVIFPSRYVLDAALENTEFDDGQIDILPQGLLNEQLLEIEPTDRDSELRRSWGIPEDATLVLGCGTRDGRKGLDLFISTALIALSKVPKGTLYFGWLGGVAHTLNTQHAFWATMDLESAGIQDYFRFLDQTDQVAPFFQACDMLFLSSRIDPFPCVVNEAMAAAKPVVLFENGSGCVDLIQNEGGVVVPYGNVASAADSIIELAKFPRLRQQMGQRNRDYVKQYMNFDSYVGGIVEGLLSSMLKPCYQMIESEAYQSFCARVESDADPGHKKIIFALPAWNISGVNTFVENLIIELRKNGFDASILFTTRDSGKVEQQHLPQVPYRYLTSATLEPDEQRDRVAAYLKLNAPCVFVPNYDYISSSVSSRLPDNVGVLGVLHCDDDEHYLHGYQLGHYWNAMVAVSDTIKEKMLRLNPAFADRTHTIRYGIPAETELPPNRPIQSDRIRILYTGRMVQQQKRIFDFVELTRQLKTKRIPFELTFVGDGPDEQAMMAELAPLVEEKIVRFLGRVSPDQVSDELRKHDILVLTSEFEGLPLSLLEAMASGCVAVVTDIKSGISEILTHGDNAMLSPVGAMDEMSDNIATLHRDHELMERLRAKGFQTLFDRKLTSIQMAEEYGLILDEIFEEISSQKPHNAVPLNCPHVSSMLNVA